MMMVLLALAMQVVMVIKVATTNLAVSMSTIFSMTIGADQITRGPKRIGSF